MTKRLLVLLAALVAALGTQASSRIEPLYVHPSFVALRWQHETTVRLTPIGRHSVSWDPLKGRCYTYQIASAHIHGWQRHGNSYYFPATIRALHPGSCEMWFKSTSGADVRIFVTVER